MTIHVGTAPDSWGVWYPSDPLQTPWQRYLDEVAEAGYGAVELGPFGYLPTEPRRLADELGRRALQLAGGTLSGDLSAVGAWEEMRSRTAGVCDIVAHLGAGYVVLLDSGAETELSDSAWRRLVDTVHQVGEYTRSRGVATLFHPHYGTSIMYEPQIEKFLSLTDASLVNLCLDVGHHAIAGGEPVSFFRKHHARVPYLHLKDVANGEYVDLGQGVVDFPALKRAADEVHYDGWGIVEQDMYPAPFDKPLPIARRNLEYLNRIL